jgi:signal transduction histidine kinase
MESTPAKEPITSQSRILHSVFAVLIVGFVLINVVAFSTLDTLRSANRLLVRNTVTRTECVDKLRHDTDQMRLLTDMHIMETNSDDMMRLEARIHELDAAFMDTARVCEPPGGLPAEHAAWASLRAQAAALAPQLREILDLSRRNQNDQARLAIFPLERRFDDLAAAIDAVVHINQEDAERTLLQLEDRRRTFQLHIGSITLGGTLLALYAVWVTRAVGRKGAQLARALARLEERNYELDAFASRVAHDLRGPLNTLVLASSRLWARVPQEQATLAILRRGLTQMDELIGDLLSLSRIDADLTGCASSTAAATAAVEAELGPQVASAGGVLRCQVEPAQVRCPESLLRQVLWNLGENAVKYRRPEEPLQLTVRGTGIGDSYELRVSDNGLGMNAEEAARAFEPFFRGQDIRGTPGSGLGLSIVRRVVSACGGSVSIESEPGRGSTFVVRLPRA